MLPTDDKYVQQPYEPTKQIEFLLQKTNLIFDQKHINIIIKIHIRK